MKRTGNKNLKIAAATMMTIFSLFTCFSGAMAWFLGMRTFSDDVEDFEVKSTRGILESITFHELAEDGVTKELINGVFVPTKYSFDQDYVGRLTYNWDTKTGTMQFVDEGQTTIELNQYTPLDQENPILLLINFYEEEQFDVGSITLDANAAVDQYLGDRDGFTPICSLSGEKYDAASNANPMIRKKVGNKSYFPLSSVAKFQYLELSATGTSYPGQKSIDDITNNTTSTYGFNLTQANNDLTDGNTFVSFEDEDTAVFEQNISIYTSSRVKMKHLALVIDYYSDAVEFIYSTFLGDDTLENVYNGVLSFVCDWTMEI